MTINNYVTLSDVKLYDPQNEVSTTELWDVMVTTLCTNLSRAFDQSTWREPGEFAVGTDSTRVFDGTPNTATDFIRQLDVDELAAVPTLVTIAGITVPSNDYWPVPYNALSQGKPFTGLYLDPDGQTRFWGSKLHSIQVTGKFGYSTAVPADVFQALLLYVIRLLRKAQQNYLETGVILDAGQIMSGSKIDEDIKDIIILRRKTRFSFSYPTG